MATPRRSVVPLYKVVLVGDMGVGKTSVYTRYHKNFFDPIRTPTFGVDNFTEELEVDGKPCRVGVNLSLNIDVFELRFFSLHMVSVD